MSSTKEPGATMGRDMVNRVNMFYERSRYSRARLEMIDKRERALLEDYDEAAETIQEERRTAWAALWADYEWPVENVGNP